MSPHRVGGKPLIAEGGKWVDSLPRVTQHTGGAGASASPGLCCFSSSASLCPLPGGSQGQEVTEFPPLSFFPPVFFQPHSSSMPFPRAVSHQRGLSSPRPWPSSLLTGPQPQWPSFPVYLMKSLEAQGPSCPPASKRNGKPPPSQSTPLCPGHLFP